jgi:hypothetical protein
VINALALLPGTLGKEAAAAITALASQHDIGMDNVGDWLVLDINAAKKAASSATTAATTTPNAPRGVQR